MIAPVCMDDVIDKLAMLVERSPKENEVFNITRPKAYILAQSYCKPSSVESLLTNALSFF
jgi:hypothetical protein